MGVSIQLSIIPEQITSSEWHTVYADTLELLNKHPDEIMGIRHENTEIFERTVYTRQLQHNLNEPDKCHWHVVGDFKSRKSCESFIFYYDINNYISKFFRNNDKKEPFPLDDILKQIIEIEYYPGNIFNAKTQGEPYHITILAVAMLVEDRFPQYAVVSGNIDLNQAKEAQKLIKKLLDRDVLLPISVDASSLYKRLCKFCDEKTALNHFNYLFQGDINDRYNFIFSIDNTKMVNEWFIEKFKGYNSPLQLGVIDLLIAWLNAGKSLKELCEMLCINNTGPKFNPVKFAAALSSTWIAIEHSFRKIIEGFIKKEGMVNTVDSQFGNILLDTHGLKGRNIKQYIDKDEVLKILENLFHSQFPDIKDTFMKKDAEIKITLSEIKKFDDDIADSIKGDKETSKDEEVLDVRCDSFMKSVANYSEIESMKLKALAYRLADVRSKLLKAQPEVSTWSIQDITQHINRISWRNGIRLTEDAWEWIDKEDDPAFLLVILSLVIIDSDEINFSSLRKEILENRDLAQNLFLITNDKNMLSEIESLLCK